jgi:hypothetical protein
MARRRQIADRRQDQPGDRYDQRAEADNDPVDPGLKAQLERAQFGPDKLQVLFGGDVVVDRVENLGGDPFGLLAIDIGVGQGIGQGEPVGQRRLRLALRIRGAAEGRCGTGRVGVHTLSVAVGILAHPDASAPRSRGGC